ncbi:MAG: hypothetical protein K2M65_01475, partial [Muribaculaceae bacterium]|nr:hypothetical protein [Muribaculaceae bacterium]
ISIQRLHAQGRAVGVTLKGTIREPFKDPLVNGQFDGYIDLSMLPPVLTKMIPAHVTGIANGHTSFRLRMSHLNSKSIHHVKVNGRLLLTQLNLTDRDSIFLYMHRAELRLGTNSSFSRDSLRADSLLTLSAQVDSAWIRTPELYTQLKDVRMGMGCKNDASILDSTSITPIGATIHTGSLYYKSLVDSARLIIRDMDCGAVLTRFKGQHKVPQLGMKASLRRAFVIDSKLRLALGNGQFNINAHLNPKTPMSGRLKARYDSIAAANPGISTDSIRQIMAAQYRRNISENDAERMSLALDQGTAALIRRLDLKGSLSATSGRIITPMFPLRNRFTDLSCSFTTDSLILHSA